MSKNSRRYLDLRGLTYWFKRDIPQAIRLHFDGKTAYLVNLGTSDLKLAMSRRDDIERETDKLYREAREGRTLSTSQDNVRMLGEAWAAELAMSMKDPMQWTARVTGRKASDVEDEDIISPHDLIEEQAESIERNQGSAAKARFLNIVSGRVAIDHHLEAYLKEAKLAPKTTAERRNLVAKFARWADEAGLTIGDIDRAVAGKYVSTEISPLDPSTAKKHLGSVKLYWDYLIMRGHVRGKNPWEGQTMPNRGRRVERDADVEERPFTTDEMKTLLYSAFPKGMKKEFEQQLQDAMRISALSGMRIAEVVTLWVEECPLDEQGVGHFDIRHGKTRAAKRRVPIHPDLIEIIRRRKKDKGPPDWLFHELTDEKNPSDVFGKRFAQYRKKLKVEDKVDGKRRSLVNFHSFRRWFVTEAEQAGQQESIISEVVGHEEGRKSITFKVYSGGPSEDQKRKCVEAVKLPDASS
ncbi:MULTISPECIES: tyrosine-type recombinase/integrase [unclassified Ensifer]|uniref:tyrosine-type recombinase/integrase n=1 Tax=unclassified Ensifer TaxID=2633371 RepID=UPI000812D94D|nr:MULTISPECIES: tyrosine-type recombinase/integrase [unclassified Ensifer]OCP20981.1 hypothetical protein BC363_29250 [Ensifer sp. LC384]OCP21222.1 hypothetical protein BC361_27170 [Ensifer sp. LC54]